MHCHQTESGYVRNANQPISNDNRTFRSPCKHINTTHFTIHTCLMMGEASLETSPKNNMIQDMINSDNMSSDSEDEDQSNLLMDKHKQEETYLELRHIGRTNKMDLESFIIGKEYYEEVIKVHFEDNASNTTKNMQKKRY